MKRWRFRFEPRDCWVGFFFDKHGRVYFIVVPMLPLVYYRKSHWRITESGVPAYYHPTPVR